MCLQALKAALRQLTVLDQSAAQDSDALVVTKETAAKYKPGTSLTWPKPKS